MANPSTACRGLIPATHSTATAMHFLEFNCKAKTLTEVPPSEFGADSDCRYFYVQGKHATVPISTPDGIGEIVWQHPDYQPPSPANAMTTTPTPLNNHEKRSTQRSILPRSNRHA